MTDSHVRLHQSNIQKRYLEKIYDHARHIYAMGIVC